LNLIRMKQSVSSKQRALEFRRNPTASRPSRDGKPADGDKKPKDKAKRRRYLGQYLRWLWPYRWSLASLLTLALLAAALDMVWPLAIKAVIDRILVANPPAGQSAGGLQSIVRHVTSSRSTGNRLHELNIFGIAILAMICAKQMIDSFRSYRTVVLNAKVVFRLRHRLYERLLNLSLTDLAEMKSGGIVSRLSTDVDSVSGLVQAAVLSPGVAIIRVALTTVILFSLSWRLALAALIIIPPMATISLLWLRRVRPIYRSTHADRTDVDARVNETFGGIRIVRAFRREPREEHGYAVANHTIIRKRLWAELLEMVLEFGWGVLIPATSLLIVWYGGRLYLHDPPLLDVGDIFAFQIYAVLLLQPVWAIVSSISQTQKSMAAMERVFEAMEMPLDKPDRPDAVDAPASVEEVRFDDVSFEYRAGVPVIRNFSLLVPGGSIVALVGPSGAGKTTLTDLVARFYDPTSGALLLNGIDLRKLKLASYRSLLAVVQQETFLFDGTVRENIAYGRRGVSEDDIREAARRANAEEFILRLPEGYDTLIGERGFKLSGGQRQRLSIARAILADPQILILDEATSNLDTESEQLIQSALADLLASRTTFVIAHRLSTITHADLIVAMDAGQIREVGAHEELMEKRGLYFDMVERQRNAMLDNGLRV
jgi:ATP-binding cassette, subfamily B, bacterial